MTVKKKRRWQDMDGLEELGLSKSLLRSLDVVEGIQADLDRARSSLDGVHNVREKLERTDGALDPKAHALGRAGSLIKSANLGLADRVVPNAKAPFGRESTLFTAAYRPMGFAQDANGLLEALPQSAQGTSPIKPEPPSIIKASEVAKGLSGSGMPSIASRLAEVSRERETLKASPFSGPGVMGFGAVQPTIKFSSVFDDLQGFSVLRDLRDVTLSKESQFSVLQDVQSYSALKGSYGLFSEKVLTEIFGRNNTITAWSAAKPLQDHWMLDLARGMERLGFGFANAMQGMMPTFEEAARHASSILEVLPRIDWAAFERAARIREARRPRTRLGQAALKAYDAFYLGHEWVVDRFLRDYLGIEPTAEHREALWTVLREAFERTLPYPARWIVLDDKRAARYLRTAVYFGVKRIVRDREMADRIWWPEGEKETDKEGVKLSKPSLLGVDATIDILVRKSPGHEELLFAPPDDRGDTLTRLFEEGSAADKKLLELLISGHELAEISRVYGAQEVQRFKRKARRWRKR